jgi:hypothetical protein
VEPPREHRAEPLHEPRQVAIGTRPHDKVVVVRHHTAGQHAHVELRASLLQRAREEAELSAARDKQPPLRRAIHDVHDLSARTKPRSLRHRHPFHDWRTELRCRSCIKMRSTLTFSRSIGESLGGDFSAHHRQLAVETRRSRIDIKAGPSRSEAGPEPPASQSSGRQRS